MPGECPIRITRGRGCFCCNQLTYYMKNLLLLACLGTACIGGAQTVNFPDANFKNKLLEYYSTGLDVNEDGEIQESEALLVTGLLQIAGTENEPGIITDLTGIEAFANITGLSANYNQITSLDLSNNPLVEMVFVKYNNLTSVNLTGCSELISLHLDNNQLTTIDLSDTVNLSTLNLAFNNFTSLDVSSCPELFSFMCSNNSLTSLDVTNNPALSTLACGDNQLATLNIGDNAALALLSCGNNFLTELDVSNNTALNYLSCENNLLTELDLANTPSLINLHCPNNQLTVLDISTTIALTDLHCSENLLTQLDLSNNDALLRLTCGNNQLTQLDISVAPSLESVSCISNPLQELNVGVHPNLENLNCFDTELTELDLSGTSSLTSMSVATISELTYINLRNGNNNNISLPIAFFGSLPNLETVCLDDAESDLADHIQDGLLHQPTFTEDCESLMAVPEITAARFFLYPNPVSDVLHIESAQAIQSSEVYNSLGQQVLSGKGESIDMSALNAGTYFIRISDATGSSLTKRIVKQ